MLQTNSTFILCDQEYTNIKDLLYPDEWELINTQKKIKYYNIPCAFDIESTSFINEEGEKCAIMYEWTFGINGRVIIGRTWEEFHDLIYTVSEIIELNENKRLICYVHNLGFEFQFMCKQFNWIDVFAVKERKPVKAVMDNFIEFKCSHLLSGYSLAALGNQLLKYKINKKEGDLDYKLLRHAKTPLSSEEKNYCIYDVLVVMAYIKEKIENDGDITRIPLTKTGYVRRSIKKNCLYASANHKKNKWKYVEYHNLMKGLTLEVSEYKQLKRAFMGGFTHASCMYAGKVIDKVGSIDFTSSYPAVLCSEKFPMSKGEIYKPKDMEDFKKQLYFYCCLFDVEFVGLCANNFVDHPISYSKCFNIKNAIVDNGRVVSADFLQTTITEQDYFIYEEYYTWEEIRIANFRRYFKDYLPKDFVRTVLEFYQDKTTLKGVEGREFDYLMGKEQLNACYGACVTDIAKDKQVFTGSEWLVEPVNLAEEIEKYNEAKGRVLFYPWGIWCTAYARRNLFTGISEFGNDYIYSDTDSIKAKNMNNHKEYIDKYNSFIEYKLERAMNKQGLDISLIKPKTVKGVEKLLGVWDFEGTYDKFKTLGAKRYMTKEGDKYSFTVSGVNKKTAIPFLIRENDELFEAFNNNLYIPPEYTGKNTHTYIDVPRQGILTDYLGNTCEYYELSGIHLAACDFTLSLSKQYMDYLLGIREEDMF